MTVTRASSPRATAAPNAPNITLSAGCWSGDGTACSLGSDGNGIPGTAFVELYGSRVTITDSTAPALTGPNDDVGLRAPGTRSGDEPLTFSATDNVGIRRAEIVDVTDAANPRVVATEDYASTQTAQKTGCDFARPRPCPDLKSETIAASPAIAGKRTLLLRVTDAAGNQTVSPPFALVARGPVNGSGGGDGARLVAGFPGHAFRGHGKKRHRVGVLRPTKRSALVTARPCAESCATPPASRSLALTSACSSASSGSALTTRIAGESPAAPTGASRSGSPAARRGASGSRIALTLATIT
jgi:hypothetical protein